MKGKRKYLNSIFKITSPLIFLILLIPNSSSYEVEPVWNPLEYNQGDYAQFIINGNKNQTNISCMVRYYYDPDPLGLSNNTSVSATEFHGGISVNESGIGLFEVKLVKENGFEYPGFYNLTFRFGEDVQNETGFEIWTANRTYVQIRVRLNEQYLLDMFQGNIDESEKNVNTAIGLSNSNWGLMGWYTVILTLIFFWCLFVVYWHSKYDEPIRIAFWDKVKTLYNKLKSPLGDLYPMINADNMKELKMIGLGILGKQEKHMRERSEFHKRKFVFFFNKLRKTRQDRRTVLNDLLVKDSDDPHVWILKQHSDETIELKEGEVQFVPSSMLRVEKMKKKKRWIEVGD